MTLIGLALKLVDSALQVLDAVEQASEHIAETRDTVVQAQVLDDVADLFVGDGRCHGVGSFLDGIASVLVTIGRSEARA